MVAEAALISCSSSDGRVGPLKLALVPLRDLASEGRREGNEGNGGISVEYTSESLAHYAGTNTDMLTNVTAVTLVFVFCLHLKGSDFSYRSHGPHTKRLLSRNVFIARKMILTSG